MPSLNKRGRLVAAAVATSLTLGVTPAVAPHALAQTITEDDYANPVNVRDAYTLADTTLVFKNLGNTFAPGESKELPVTKVLERYDLVNGAKKTTVRDGSIRVKTIQRADSQGWVVDGDAMTITAPQDPDVAPVRVRVEWVEDNEDGTSRAIFDEAEFKIDPNREPVVNETPTETPTETPEPDEESVEDTHTAADHVSPFDFNYVVPVGGTTLNVDADRGSEVKSVDSVEFQNGTPDGWSDPEVDGKGVRFALTGDPSKAAEGGLVDVVVTFTDGHTRTYTFDVSRADTAAEVYNFGYETSEEPTVRDGGTVTREPRFVDPNGVAVPVPGDVKFEGEQTTDWDVDVDPNTGVVSATSPKGRDSSTTVTVTAKFPDGSTKTADLYLVSTWTNTAVADGYADIGFPEDGDTIFLTPGRTGSGVNLAAVHSDDHYIESADWVPGEKIDGVDFTVSNGNILFTVDEGETNYVPGVQDIEGKIVTNVRGLAPGSRTQRVEYPVKLVSVRRSNLAGYGDNGTADKNAESALYDGVKYAQVLPPARWDTGNIDTSVSPVAGTLTPASTVEGSTYALGNIRGSGEGWTTPEVDAKTGEIKIRQTNPSAPLLSFEVITTLPDNSTTTAVVDVPGVRSVAYSTDVKYPTEGVDYNDVTRIKPTLTSLPKGASVAYYSLAPYGEEVSTRSAEKNGWRWSIDPQTGELSVEVGKKYEAGTDATIPVLVVYSDRSYEYVEVELEAGANQTKPAPGTGSSTGGIIAIVLGILAVLGIGGFLAMNMQNLNLPRF